VWELPLPAAAAQGPATYAGQLFAAAGHDVRAPTYARVLEVGACAKGGYVLLEAHDRYRILLLGVEVGRKPGERLRPGERLGVAQAKTAYRIGLKGGGHPLYTQAGPGVTAHPRTFHPELQ
jgi:hypothetical protein